MVSHRRLRPYLLIAAVLLAGLAAAAVAVYVLLQPERFTAMLQGQAREAGLELELARPASPTLFPRPALELEGLTLTATGANAPILLAAHGRLALHWRTVFGGPTAISQLQIDAPRVDVEALQQWMASLPPSPSGITAIPRLDAGLEITRGNLVRANRMLLADFNLSSGPLHAGLPFLLGVAAKDAQGRQVQARLGVTPRLKQGTLELEELSMHLTRGADLTLSLTGHARWHGAADASASFAGTLDLADRGNYALKTKLTPADDRDPLLLAMSVDGPGTRAELAVPPLALADWWSSLGDPANTALTTPPATGHLDIDRLEASGIRIDGLSVDSDPAAAASTLPAAPADVRP